MCEQGFFSTMNARHQPRYKFRIVSTVLLPLQSTGVPGATVPFYDMYMQSFLAKK